MRKVLCTLASAALAFGGFAHAQDRDFPVPTPTPKVEPAKTVNKQITAVELGTMLENLGYDLTPLKNDKGEVFGYDTKFASEGWTINARFEISPSGRFIWMTGVIAGFKDVKDVPKEAFVAMLAESKKLGPAHIQFDSRDNVVLVALALSNVNFTPSDLRTWLEVYTSSFKQAYTSWGKAVAVAKAKETATESNVP